MSLWIRANKRRAIRYFIFEIFHPLVNIVVSNIEALRYLFRRKLAKHDLLKIREELIFVEDIAFWYSQRNFEWKSDPLGGWLDFTSKPWVSVAKNHGDCDDMMAVAEFILRPSVDEGHRAFSYSYGGSGHAMYVVRTGAEWKLVSNQRVRGGFTDPQQAVRSFYGGDTAFTYIHDVGYTEGSPK